MTYYGIFPDGNVIDHHNLQDLSQVPGLEYCLKLEYEPGNYRFGVFTLIHKDGTSNFLRIRDIELRNISTQYWDNYNKKTMATFTFYDHRLKQTVQTPLSVHLGPKFVKDVLIPFMQDYVNNIIQLLPEDKKVADNDQQKA